MKGNLYEFYEGWVWIISLASKKIKNPIKVSTMIPSLPSEMSFKNEGYMYHDGSAQIRVIYGNQIHTVDVNNYDVLNRENLKKWASHSNDTKINGTVSTYNTYNKLFFMEINLIKEVVSSTSINVPQEFHQIIITCSDMQMD